MQNKQNLKPENYLGFFLLLATLMAFAVIVKSCNVAGYQAERAVQQSSGSLKIDQRR
ncbi:MAG: hypothetical protein RBR43_02890 [Desulfuromonadaceae bacterium]|nr:hypothetical protein [Desulfuromonas sp.]MDY0184810.1 hypothetical protein [Desulfuromonadaceae bacterium]